MKFLLIFTLFISVVLLVAVHLVYLATRIAGYFARFEVAYRYCLLAVAVLCGVWILMCVWGYYFGRFKMGIKEVELSFSSLPEKFDGFRIVHISDLHLDGWRGDTDRISKIVSRINSLNADVICFTGDLVSVSYSETEPVENILNGFTRPVYSVLGNHDYFPYSRLSDAERLLQIDSLKNKEKEFGWNLLLNESVEISREGEKIVIAGVENQSCGAHNVIHRGDLKRTLEGHENDFVILLSHDPSHWRAEVLPDSGVQLTLSGHTHAMQFRCFGWTPSKYIYPECDGLYEEGTQKLYVNIGLGGTFPARFGATPEITVITLHKQ